MKEVTLKGYDLILNSYLQEIQIEMLGKVLAIQGMFQATDTDLRIPRGQMRSLREKRPSEKIWNNSMHPWNLNTEKNEIIQDILSKDSMKNWKLYPFNLANEIMGDLISRIQVQR